MKKIKKIKYTGRNNKNLLFVDQKKQNPLVPIAIIFSIVFLLGLFVISGLRKGNKVILSKVEIESDQLPKSFDGYKILQISDIFSRELGTRQSKIKKLLEHEDYDIVIFTGDFVLDDTEEDYWVIRDLLSCLKEKTPIYYIVGDTDYKPGWVNDSSDRWKMCINPPEKTKFMRFFEENYDAKFIYPMQRIESETGEAIYLTGIEYDKNTMNEVDFDPDGDFSITVTHKAVNYDVSRRLKDVNKRTITEIDYDLNLAGDACGGQYRLPLLGTVWSDGYGWFPQESDVGGLTKDSAGRYRYINGGLGQKSGVRFYNNPEISIITLKCASEGDK